MGIGANDKLVDGGLSNASSRKIDHPFQGLFIGWIDDQTKVAQHVFNFFALVEGQATENAVGNVTLAQGVLNGSGLGVGAVKHCKTLVVQLVVHFIFKNGTRHKSALVTVGQ